jgi:hypothetical protein
MDDLRQLLAKHGLGFLLATGGQKNDANQQDGSVMPPPEPNKMPSAWDLMRPDGGGWKTNGAWDPRMVQAWDKTRVGNRTLDDIAGTLYNENKGLRGGDTKKGYAGQKELDRGVVLMGHALINAGLKPLPLTYAAKSDTDANEKNSSLYQYYQQRAREALEERSRGIDPTHGKTQYNHRFNDSHEGRKTKSGKLENFFTSVGPFENAGSRKHVPSRIVIYDDAKSPATSKKPVRKKR